MDRVVITAAVDGPIAVPSDNPNLPYTPEQFAEQAKAVYQEGASVIHIHSRGADGLPTSDYGRTKAILDAVHESCPILTQLSTGGFFPYEERARLVELKPRMASLNLCTMTFGNIRVPEPAPRGAQGCCPHAELGVKGELEIYDTGHLDFALRLLKEGFARRAAAVLRGSGRGRRRRRDSREPEHPCQPYAPERHLANDRHRQGQPAADHHRSGHGRQRPHRHRRHALLTKGVVADNQLLVRRLVGVAKAIGRTPATVEETEQMLQLPKIN